MYARQTFVNYETELSCILDYISSAYELLINFLSVTAMAQVLLWTSIGGNERFYVFSEALFSASSFSLIEPSGKFINDGIIE